MDSVFCNKVENYLLIFRHQRYSKNYKILYLTCNHNKIWIILYDLNFDKGFFLYIVVDIIVSLFEQVNGVYCFCYCLVANNISLFVTLWNVVHQAPLSSTIYQSLLKFISTE